MSVEETLVERGTRYGDFATHALITQALKDVVSGEYAQAGEAQKKLDCVRFAGFSWNRCTLKLLS